MRKRIAVILTGLLFTTSVATADNFLTRFLSPEYLLPVVPLDLSGQPYSGDLSARYSQVFLPVIPSAEVLILGEFPRARYFSITVYDDHGAIADVLHDFEIEPLLPGTENPLRPGGEPGAEDVLYAVTVQMGADLATNPAPQCSLPGLDVHASLLDARFRHTAGDHYSCVHSNFSTWIDGVGEVHHDDSPGNPSMSIMFRWYLKRQPAPDSVIDLTTPLVWLRYSASGCAPALAPPGEFVDPAQWFQGASVLDEVQVQAHVQRRSDLGETFPHGGDPGNVIRWRGADEYALKSAVERHAASGILFSDDVYPDLASQLNAEGRVLALLMRLPTLPCSGGPPCVPLGSEMLRYWGLSFVDDTHDTIATLTERDLVVDPDGHATLVVSFGTPLPARIDASHGYTVLELPAKPLAYLGLRNILPDPAFQCSTSSIPSRVGEHHAEGGYMGDYAPFGVYVVPSDLPHMAPRLTGGGSCTPAVPEPDPCAAASGSRTTAEEVRNSSGGQIWRRESPLARRPSSSR